MGGRGSFATLCPLDCLQPSLSDHLSVRFISPSSGLWPRTAAAVVAMGSSTIQSEECEEDDDEDNEDEDDDV